MVEAGLVLRLAGGAILLLANGFFVTTEFAMTRVRQFTAEEFDGPGLERAWAMTERLEIYLSGCQVGITVSSVGLGVMAEPAVTAILDPWMRAAGLGAGDAAGHTAAAVILALGLINLLHVIIGEQAPTYLGVERTKLVAKYGAPPLYWWTRVMWPVIVMADMIAKQLLGLFGVEMTRSWTDEELAESEPSSRGELRREMGERLARAGLSAERREEVINALEIGRMPVADVMVQRDDIVSIRVGEDTSRALETVRDQPHARYPVVENDLNSFVGILYTPSLIAAVADSASVDIHSLLTAPMVVEAETPVSDVIDQFQAANQEMALVTRSDAVVGLVTATDCFEAITGELEDPLDIDSGPSPSAPVG